MQLVDLDTNSMFFFPSKDLDGAHERHENVGPEQSTIRMPAAVLRP